MLFRKNIEKHCAYCALAGEVDAAHMICRRCGIVPSEHACRHFVYDPLKRVPPKQMPADFSKYDQKDFSL